MIKDKRIDFNYTRANVLKWLIRLQERCRISDKAWFKAVTIFDQVQDQIKEEDFNSLYIIAGTSLYLCSKNFDAKYLYAHMFIEGIRLTKIGRNNDHSISVELPNLLKYETIILDKIGFSLGFTQIVTAQDFYVRYFDIARCYVDQDTKTEQKPAYSLDRCQFFG